MYVAYDDMLLSINEGCSMIAERFYRLNEEDQNLNTPVSYRNNEYPKWGITYWPSGESKFWENNRGNIYYLGLDGNNLNISTISENCKHIHVGYLSTGYIQYIGKLCDNYIVDYQNNYVSNYNQDFDPYINTVKDEDSGVYCSTAPVWRSIFVLQTDQLKYDQTLEKIVKSHEEIEKILKYHDSSERISKENTKEFKKFRKIFYDIKTLEIEKAVLREGRVLNEGPVSEVFDKMVNKQITLTYK